MIKLKDFLSSSVGFANNAFEFVAKNLANLFDFVTSAFKSAIAGFFGLFAKASAQNDQPAPIEQEAPSESIAPTTFASSFAKLGSMFGFKATAKPAVSDTLAASVPEAAKATDSVEEAVNATDLVEEAATAPAAAVNLAM